MAILNRKPRSTRALVWALLVGLGLSVSGCLVLQQMGWLEEPKGFPHDVHVLDEELECMDCHLYWEDEEEPGMPRQRGCMLCHEDIDPDLEPDRRVESFYVDGELVAARYGALDDEVIFSHLDHVTDEEGCADCHGAVAESAAVTPDMAVDMDECMACHAETGEANECSTCHQEWTIETAPAHHDAFWMRQHGQRVRSQSCPEERTDQCELCHTDASCTACHKTEMPQSHTNYWRRRGHGLTASMDRESCAACHGIDYCDRCHQTATPMSHTGLWGGTKSMHCVGCHDSSPQSSCFFCHRTGTPSHALASPQPPGHDPASDCRECHMILRHVDDGGDCNRCHF